MKIGIIVCLFLVFLVNGCAPIVFPATYALYPKDKDIKSAISIIALVLQEHDFTLSVVNSDVGIITTDWKSTGSAAMEAIGILGGNPYHEHIKLSINIDTANNRIIIKPVKQTYSKLGGWSDVRLGDKDQKMLDTIAKDISSRL